MSSATRPGSYRSAGPAIFFGKFVIVLSYSIRFILLTAGASVLFGMLSGYITFEWNGFAYLLKKCMEIAMLTRMKKGYWLALVFAEIYSFAGLFASMSETLKTVYPITAVFQLSGYYEAAIGNKVVSLVILIVCMVLAVLV